MSSSIEALIPELQGPAHALLDLAGRAGVQPRVTSTLRTRYEQERLYRRYQQGLNVYPVAVPGTSAHEYGYAFDCVVSGADNQQDLGTVWQSWGGVWGGNRDPIHFEYPGFSPPASTRGASRGTVPGAATVGDLILSMIPGVGAVELTATIASLLGAPQSTVLEFLQAPVSTAVDQGWWPPFLAYLQAALPLL